MQLTTVKLRRFERGLLQLEVARRTRITWGRLSAIENGDAVPKPDELQRIAAALGVTLEALLGCAST